MQTKTISGNHSGVSYFVNLDDHGGKYKAKSTMLFSTHNHIVDWNQEGSISPVDFTECKGNHYFYDSPELTLVECTKAFIDGVVGMIAMRDRVAANDFTGINQNNFSECIYQINRLTELTKEAKLMQQKIRPETQPTDDQLVQMKAQIERMVSIFTITGIASITGNSRQTVSGWLSRGRISAQAAHEICQLPEIKAHGFTRENVRPDVKFWYI